MSSFLGASLSATVNCKTERKEHFPCDSTWSYSSKLTVLRKTFQKRILTKCRFPSMYIRQSLHVYFLSFFSEPSQLLLFSSPNTSMEIQVKVSDAEQPKAQCQIKAKNLFYSQPHHMGKLGWLCWRDMIAPSNSTKHILRNVNFEANPGEITAISGTSGAGKTTLLDILAGVALPGRVSGHILMNDQPMSTANLYRISGYVTQDEVLFPLLTVEETLLFSACFRLHLEAEKVKTRVRELVRELGLDHVANERIGSESHRGISGGEKRRVSIGVDLVHDPSVLFVDEPTTGLDSASALQVMKLLKSFVREQDKTIIVTIHQPGFRILELLDQVVLLSKGGVVHHGPLDLLEERLRLAGHCIPAHVNVLEFAIDVSERLVVESAEDEEKSDEHKEHSSCWRRQLQSMEVARENCFFYPNSHRKEILVLCQRFSYNIFRTKELFATKITHALIAGFLLGNIFMNANNNPGKAKLQTQFGFLAFSLTFLLSSTTEALPVFLQERKILIRETSRGAYRVSSYVLASTLVFVPFLFIVSLLYSTPVYWLVGLRREIDGFLYFCLVVWLVVLMSNSFVACCSTLVPNFIMGSSLIAGTVGAFFLFSGYFITKEDIPRYWMFMHYLSLFRYPFECFVLNEYGGEHGRIRCLESVDGQCLLYADLFLKQQGLEESQKWSNLGVMLAFICGYRFICFLILQFRSCRARRWKISCN